MNKNFIPIWKFASKYGISKATIYSWIQRGKIPVDRIKKEKKIVERTYIDESLKIIIKKNENSGRNKYQIE